MKLIRKLLIIVFLVYILTQVFHVQDILMEQFYPTPYEESVEKYTEIYQVDKYLVYATMKTESKFEENVVSSSKAKGLMQLMEATAMELAAEEGIPYTENKTIFDLEINIQLGIKYIAKLINYYEGNTVLAIIAYNAGIGNVNKWIAEKTIKADGSDTENIPFKETNMYVRKIFREYKLYLNIYT